MLLVGNFISCLSKATSILRYLWQTKFRGKLRSFPSDDALLKLFYLALNNISQKWTMPIRDWKAALTRFTIQFENRMTQH